MDVRRAEQLAAIAFALAALVPLAIGVYVIVSQPPPDPECREWCGLATGIGTTLIGIGGVGLAWAAAIWWRQRWAQFLAVPACVVAAAVATGYIAETRFQTEFLALEIAVAVMAVAWAAAAFTDDLRARRVVHGPSVALAAGTSRPGPSRGPRRPRRPVPPAGSTAAR